MSETSASASENDLKLNQNPPQLTKEETFGFFGNFVNNAAGSSLVQPRKTTNLNLDSVYLQQVTPKCTGFKRPRSAENLIVPVNNGSAGASNKDLQASLMDMFKMNVTEGHVKQVTAKDDAEKDDADSDLDLPHDMNSTTYANCTSPVSSMRPEEELEVTLAFSSPFSTSHSDKPQAGPPVMQKKPRTRVTNEDAFRSLFT